MADIDYWVDEFQNSMSELNAMMTELRQGATNNCDTKELISIVKTTETKLEATKKIQKSCGIELRVLRDKEKRNLIEELVQKLNKDLHNLQKEFNFIKATTERDNLLGKATTSLAASVDPSKVNTNDPFNIKGKNNDELLNETHKIQDLTFDSLARTRNLIQESEEIGAATLEQLQRQHEQMHDIEKEVDNLDNNVKKAEHLILSFTKRMASDRIIQFFAAINICLIIALIAYSAVTGKTIGQSTSGGKKSGGVPPSDPTRSPTYSPIFFPSSSPTATPGSPSFAPTFSPTSAPSFSPTIDNTAAPTSSIFNNKFFAYVPFGYKYSSPFSSSYISSTTSFLRQNLHN